MKFLKSSGKPKKIKKPLIVRRVVGHSMVPTLPPKTRVIGTGFIKEVKVGQIVVIVHNGMEKIKRIGQIKDNQIFVLGDHPETSTDSRQFGWLPITVIKARIFWPRPKS